MVGWGGVGWGGSGVSRSEGSLHFIPSVETGFSYYASTALLFLLLGVYDLDLDDGRVPLVHCDFDISLLLGGAGVAQWLERRIRDWKVAGSNPCRSGGRLFFSVIDFLCRLLFWYPFHPGVTAVARKRSRSFCQKCGWQVTAKHAYTLRMWLCMKWYFAWLYVLHRTCAETAAVSCGTSPVSAVSTPLRWIFKKKKS